jgi:hypothetical protein
MENGLNEVKPQSIFSGLELGERPAFKFGHTRIERAAIRYIKGLHRYVFNERVPDDAVVRAVINPEAMWAQKYDVIDTFRSGKMQIIQDKIFAFKFGRIIENPKASGRLLLFYESFPILGYVRPHIIGSLKIIQEPLSR